MRTRRSVVAVLTVVGLYGSEYDGYNGVTYYCPLPVLRGLYEENGSVLFVTRGLGNSGPSFRVFNRPEIAVLTLRRAEG